MNWEAITMIGGASVVLCLILSIVVISIRRRKAPREGPLEAVVLPAGVAIASLQVVAMLAGMILVRFVPETSFGWGRVVFCLVYFSGTFAGIVLLDGFLEKRGVKIRAVKSSDSPPNKSLEPTRGE